MPMHAGGGGRIKELLYSPRRGRLHPIDDDTASVECS